uniref:Uncharacterized protein n=1 Tax=Knipowitschia caucasica TaxID=637954 RepID=A0AAV2IVH9_KNICA
MPIDYISQSALGPLPRIPLPVAHAVGFCSTQAPRSRGTEAHAEFLRNGKVFDARSPLSHVPADHSHHPALDLTPTKASTCIFSGVEFDFSLDTLRFNIQLLLGAPVVLCVQNALLRAASPCGSQTLRVFLCVLGSTSAM